MLEENTDYLKRDMKRAVQIMRLSKVSRLMHSPWKELYSLALRKIGKVSESTARTFYGDTLVVILPDLVSLSIYRYGVFEEELTYSLLRFLKRGDIFIDVGAHIGYFTLLASRLVGDSGQVIAFEPTPRSRGILEYNTKYRTNVKIEPFAAWSRSDAVLNINDFGWTFSAYNSAFNPRIAQNLVPEKIQARTVALDEYLARHGVVPSFVKIDAESAEFEILKGMVQTLHTCQPLISVEVGDFDLPGVPTSRELIEHLMGCGYKPFECQGGELVDHQIRDRYGYNNILFIPKTQ